MGEPVAGDGMGIRALPASNPQGAGTQDKEKTNIDLLAEQLTQGGWIGGFTMGIGLMALLGGALLLLLAGRTLRSAREMLAAQNVSEPRD